MTPGECSVLSASGSPALSVIRCLGFKVILELSLDLLLITPQFH